MWSERVGHIVSASVCWYQILHRANGPLTRYVKLQVAHAPGKPGTFSPSPRVRDPDMHHDTCVTHVPWCMSGSLTSGLFWNRWRGKRSRHSRRMRNPKFYVSGKRPIATTYHWSEKIANLPRSGIVKWVQPVTLWVIKDMYSHSDNQGCHNNYIGSHHDYPMPLVVIATTFSGQYIGSHVTNQVVYDCTWLTTPNLVKRTTFSFSGPFSIRKRSYCPACRTTLVATRFRVAVICPIIQVPHCIRVFFYFVWFVFINHIFQFYYELCTYCNILDIYLS